MRKLIVLLAVFSLHSVGQANGIGNFFGALVGKSAVFTPEAPIDDVLAKLSAQMNENLPMVVDNETRLDSVSAVPGRHFIYHYTLLTLSRADVDPDDFHKTIKPRLKSRLCGSAEMQNFLKNGVTISYLYKSKDGQPVGGAKLAPSECARKY
jgi:hypothetical protein